MKPRRARSKLRGFTLIELMVACVLTMIVGLLLVSVYSRVGSSYRQIETRTEKFREGRAALRFMADEFMQRVALSRENPLPSVELGIAPNEASIGFLARLPVSAQPSDSGLQSDVCLVAYFLAPSSTGFGQDLYRRLISSGEVYKRISSRSDSLFQRDDFDIALSEPIATNVVDFEITLRDANRGAVETLGEASYVELDLGVVSGRAAATYFAANTPASLRDDLKKKEVKDFSVRWKL